MTLTVKINTAGKIYTEVIDNIGGDEYVLHQVEGASGSFVGQVKSEYEAVLEEIFEKCFDPEIFKSKWAKEVIAYVRSIYGDEIEYLWKKFPNNAVVRRKDNKKWYPAESWDLIQMKRLKFLICELSQKKLKTQWMALKSYSVII